MPFLPSQEELEAAAIGRSSGQEVEAPLEVEGPLEVEAPILIFCALQHGLSAHAIEILPRFLSRGGNIRSMSGV